jgi:hypothetical protein
VQGLASALTKAWWRAGIASSCCTMQEKTAQANDATQQQTNSSMLLQRATTHAYPQPYHTCTHSTAMLPTPYHTGNQLKRAKWLQASPIAAWCRHTHDNHPSKSCYMYT